MKSLCPFHEVIKYIIKIVWLVMSAMNDVNQGDGIENVYPKGAILD